MYMGTAQLLFAGYRAGIGPLRMTGSDVSHCSEACSAHAQPEVAPYSPLWGLLTGGDVNRVTGRGSVRKGSCPEVGSAHARIFPRFFLSSSNMATGCDLR